MLKSAPVLSREHAVLPWECPLSRACRWHHVEACFGLPLSLRLGLSHFAVFVMDPQREQTIREVFFQDHPYYRLIYWFSCIALTSIWVCFNWKKELMICSRIGWRGNAANGDYGSNRMFSELIGLFVYHLVRNPRFLRKIYTAT